MAIVYEHIRNDTNEVFYVGIGEEEKRAFNKHHRSPYWKHIVNKVGYSVNIIYKDIDWEDACKIEKLLIEKYGRKDLGLGNLVNMTDGGEGGSGVVVSEETRGKLSEGKKGNTNMLGKTQSKETRKKIGEANKGKTHSEETRKKIGEAKKGDKHPMFGKTHSDETRQKLSEANKGDKHPMFGKTRSDEVKDNMAKGAKHRKNVKGYSFYKAIKKYQARIIIGRKQIHLGLFDTPEEASQAYQQAKLIYHA